jgi:hypothetical protein
MNSVSEWSSKSSAIYNYHVLLVILLLSARTYDGKTALLRVDAISKEGEIDLTQLFCPVE